MEELGFYRTLTHILKTNIHEDPVLVERITLLLINITASSSVNIPNLIIDGLVPLLEHLLECCDSDITINTIWSLSNMLQNNSDLKALFISIGMTGKIRKAKNKLSSLSLSEKKSL